MQGPTSALPQEAALTPTGGLGVSPVPHGLVIGAGEGVSERGKTFLLTLPPPHPGTPAPPTAPALPLFSPWPHFAGCCHIHRDSATVHLLMTKEPHTSKSSPAPGAPLEEAPELGSGVRRTWHSPRIQCKVPPERRKARPGRLFWAPGASSLLPPGHLYLHVPWAPQTQVPPRHISSSLPFTKGIILPGTQPPSPHSSDSPSPFVPHPASSFSLAPSCLPFSIFSVPGSLV